MRYRIASRTGLILAVTAGLGVAGPLHAQNTSHSGGHNGAVMTMAPPPPPPPPPDAPVPPPPPPPPTDTVDPARLPVCSATVMDSCREGAAPVRAYRRHHRRRH